MSWQSNLKKRLENNKIKSKQQLLLFNSDKIDAEIIKFLSLSKSLIACSYFFFSFLEIKFSTNITITQERTK